MEFNEKQILEKAQKDYPQGTKFWSLMTNRLFTSNGRFELIGMADRYKVQAYVKEGRMPIDIFSNGKWAKIEQKANAKKVT